MRGQTASAGFQIGVRRTYPISPERAWAFLLSPEGLKLWLGELSQLELQAGHRYTTEEGTTGELRVVNPVRQLRMTWQPKGWEQHSTLQIRLIPSSSDPEKTTISFHQEKLRDAHAREAMKRRWEEVAAGIMEKVTD
ncbi:SRPBCC family protein [Cohnella nanjingensis]|uniref:SRPBCC domain-containing protein n=1 Tax=Cohnella nanjingensis TaxID=1387779 RepID=A0A7X0RTH9_9BACL|nr:SRPBCC domain-containing protein [Cohnella nanjingensis]MBB6672181.1 SRPBCC domain-containing protein [Cohnella nanjingensis]